MAEVQKATMTAKPTYIVRLSLTDDPARAERILRAAVLQINDRVIPLYEGQTPPERLSELEKRNYEPVLRDDTLAV